MTDINANALEQLLSSRMDPLGCVAETNGAKLVIVSDKSADELQLAANDLVLVDSSLVNQQLIGCVVQVKRCGQIPALLPHELAVLKAEAALETAAAERRREVTVLVPAAEDETKQNGERGAYAERLQVLTAADLKEKVEVSVMLVGTFYYRLGSKQGVFKTSLSGYPNIGARSYLLSGNLLALMRQVMDSHLSEHGPFVQIGADYGISSGTFMDGNRFFQRHALIAGSTGSGKSWTTAYLLERAAELKNANCLLFDLHGEYSSLRGPNITHFHIAASGFEPEPTWLSPDWMEDKIRNQSSVPLFLPLWMLPFEELQRIVLGASRSESNAANQIQLLRQGVSDQRKLHSAGKTTAAKAQDISPNAPVPFTLQELQGYYESLLTVLLSSQRTPVLTNINRIKARIDDLDCWFMTCPSPVLQQPEALDNLCTALFDNKIGSVSNGIKIVDCSHLSSQMRYFAISIICRLALEVQSRVSPADCLPLTLFCDEAHLYMNNEESLNSQRRVFERIAKEGRKYGLSLVVISQRPADISTTVLSQCCNFIIMRLTSSYDQTLVRSLLPESMGDFAERLPYFEVGEALLIGDAFMMPSRVKLMEPRLKPLSSTVETWDIWSRGGADAERPEQHALRIKHALNSWRQSFGLPPAKT